MYTKKKTTEPLALDRIEGEVTNAAGIAKIVEEVTGHRPSRQTAFRFIQNGEIPSIRISPRGDHLILRSDIERFANDLMRCGRSIRKIRAARAAERRLIEGSSALVDDGRRRGSSRNGTPASKRKTTTRKSGGGR